MTNASIVSARGVLAGVGLALALSATSASAQNRFSAQQIASGFSRPVFMTAPAGDTTRLFVVEQRGSAGVTNRADIDIIDRATNTILPTPFLSITGVTTGSEQGLLGLAFSPNYATDGLFFIHYTNSGGATVIERVRVSSTDPNVADPASRTIIFTFPQPFANHNGGWIGFGPDNHLYIALGDGGSGNDPGDRSQSLTLPLGKMLRIEVLAAAAANGTYTIPPNNPFVSTAGARGEIWHYGLRNHWRNSFDRATGELWIGDVGQNAREEINVAPAGVGGINFGWRCWEGNIRTPNIPTGGGQPCAATVAAAQAAGITFPVLDYDRTGGRCSVTGGYVYRGPSMPWLRGTYFYADYCGGQVYNINYTGAPNPAITEVTASLAGATGSGLVSFAEDAEGELYIVQQSSPPRLMKIVATCPVNCDGSTGAAGTLSPADFTCFLSSYRAGDPYADCDASGGLSPADFTCFLAKYRAGCP